MWRIPTGGALGSTFDGLRCRQVRDLRWTLDRVKGLRARLASFAVERDDPSMGIYNE
jgi:hypothetical protein